MHGEGLLCGVVETGFDVVIVKVSMKVGWKDHVRGFRQSCLVKRCKFDRLSDHSSVQ